MADFITLSCPSCRAKLQITDDIDRFACLHCDNEHLVRRRGRLEKEANELLNQQLEEVSTVLERKQRALEQNLRVVDGSWKNGV